MYESAIDFTYFQMTVVQLEFEGTSEFARTPALKDNEDCMQTLENQVEMLVCIRFLAKL